MLREIAIGKPFFIYINEKIFNLGKSAEILIKGVYGNF